MSCWDTKSLPFDPAHIKIPCKTATEILKDPVEFEHKENRLVKIRYLFSENVLYNESIIRNAGNNFWCGGAFGVKESLVLSQYSFQIFSTHPRRLPFAGSRPTECLWWNKAKQHNEKPFSKALWKGQKSQRNKVAVIPTKKRSNQYTDRQIH